MLLLLLSLNERERERERDVRDDTGSFQTSLNFKVLRLLCHKIKEVLLENDINTRLS